MTQQLTLLGVNHKTAPLEVREKCAFGPDEIRDFLRRGCDSYQDLETVVVSTCNRTEIYARFPAASDTPDSRVNDLLRLLCEAGENDPDSFEPHFYRYHCDDAVQHLFRLAGGLDSMIVGEGEILRQIRDAFELARENGSIGWFFHRLFPAAIKAGRRVRSDTDLSKGCITPGQAALRLSDRHLNGKSREVLIIGSGDIARLAALAFREQAPERLFVVNRSPERAEKLVQSLGEMAHQRPWDDLHDLLAHVDVVISSTSAKEAIVQNRDFDTILESRGGRPLTVIDLAVPRDFESEIGNHESVHLYNIDDLQEVVQKNIDGRRVEIPRAEDILQEEVRTFFSQMNWSHLEPVICRIRERFEHLRTIEIEKVSRGLPEDIQERIERFSHSLMNKFLHFPIDKLKSLRDGQDLNRTEIAFLQRLFLNPEGGNAEDTRETDGSDTTDRDPR